MLDEMDFYRQEGRCFSDQNRAKLRCIDDSDDDQDMKDDEDNDDDQDGNQSKLIEEMISEGKTILFCYTLYHF